MNKFEGLKDIDKETLRLVCFRIEDSVRSEEMEEMWDCLYKKEHELESLEEEYPNLHFLTKLFAGGLAEVVKDELAPEDYVWFRYYCLNFLLEILGAIAKSHKRV
jgi:hypothetical protein